VLAMAFFAAFGQDTPESLPDGKGKEALKTICTGCHEIGAVIGSRRTRIGWQRNVEEMVSRGAEGSEEDLQALIDYLTRFYGKVNVNTASAKEMESSLGLAPKQAEAIVAYRQQNGNYKSFPELEKTPGVDAAVLRALRSQIAFSQ